jgi:GLPGLI family protein
MSQIFNKILILGLVISTNLSAQSNQNYEILFEKKVNMAKLFPWWDQNDKDKKFHKETYKLKTNSEYSYYERQEKDIADESNNIWSYMTYSNTYIDIKNHKQVSQKEVGEKTFLMQDSVPKIQWHIYDELRNIAGYTCHKAMGRYNDSIIIVAYYTEQLEAAIGPESIGGLPGTILGIVIPKLETTWLALSVTTHEQAPITFLPKPTKGEKVNISQLYDIVRKVYKDYNKPYTIIYRVLL